MGGARLNNWCPKELQITTEHLFDTKLHLEFTEQLCKHGLPTPMYFVGEGGRDNAFEVWGQVDVRGFRVGVWTTHSHDRWTKRYYLDSGVLDREEILVRNYPGNLFLTNTLYKQPPVVVQPSVTTHRWSFSATPPSFDDLGGMWPPGGWNLSTYAPEERPKF